jgi:phosphinothricin acetyltransferase
MERKVGAPRIRLATDGDGAAVAAIYRPVVEQTAISFETVAPTAEDMARLIRETVPTYPWLVCEIGGQVVGYGYATKHRVRSAYRWSVDTSVYVSEDYRRRGVGRGLYRSLFAILAVQGFYSAFAGIALPNPASVGLHESLGFEPVGVFRRVGHKLGGWHDVGWWQLTLRESEEQPTELRDLTAVSIGRDWSRLLASGESEIDGGAT